MKTPFPARQPGPVPPAAVEKSGRLCYLLADENKIMAVLFLLLLTRAAPAGEIRAMVGPNWSKYLFSSRSTT